MEYDFSGYATKNDLKCSDGRTIRKNAFADCDGKTVPICWQHLHNEPSNVLGHAVLENREDGVYAYGTFNDTENGKAAKKLVEHGDITAMSIYANQLEEYNKNVMHGTIIEVSLVHGGANPGALIDNICLQHSDGTKNELDDEAIITTGETIIAHANEKDPPKKMSDDNKIPEDSKKETSDESDDNKTIAEILDSMTDAQKKAVYAIAGKIAEDLIDENEGEDKSMKHNVFETETNENERMLTKEEGEAIIHDAFSSGSLKQAALAHGINHIDYLFPDEQVVGNQVELYTRDMNWVSTVMNSVNKSPFSRIKSIFANLTEEDARAKGYIKGKQKKDQVFGLLKRTTTPTTIYKKQRIDRDDLDDISNFDVVALIKKEMRFMLDEELARAILIGDGRNPASDDKINEQNIRPIWTDDDFYTIKTVITSTSDSDANAKNIIRAAIKSRDKYKGSGFPVLFASESVISDLLLLEDKNGRIIYDNMDKLANALRVKAIVPVPVMEGVNRNVEGTIHNLLCLIVNLKDYNVGADKGGQVAMFDDFDIDFNQQKYLIETRCSGALIRPYSAIAIESVAGPGKSVASDSEVQNVIDETLGN